MQSSANAPNWFADALAAAAPLNSTSTANDLFAAVVAYVNSDPTHIAAGATASITSA